VLRQLYWLPVRQPVEYKVACLVHQSLAGQTPAHIADDIQLVTDSDRRQLYAQPPPGHASFRGRTTSAIEASMLQARACGTVYRRTCDETWTLRVSSVNWKHFYLGVSQPRRIVTAVLRLRNTLTYLITHTESDRYIRAAVVRCRCG